MRIRIPGAVLLVAICCASCTDRPVEHITAEGILSDVEALSADSMEGRAAGTPGAARAAAYIANRFEQIGLEPFGDSYLLPVELVGMTKSAADSSVSITGPAGTLALENDVNITVWSTAEKPVVDLAEVPIVFVGYGVQAPEYDWNDLKEEDVRGKVLLFLNNDPQLEEDGEALFGGPARTYYGRWTYKFEQAAKLGAVGAIVVHTLESASYPFSVIGNTGSRRVWQRTYKLDFLSWMDADTTSVVAAAMDTTLPGLFEMANRRDFRPVDTGYRVNAHIETAIERVQDANVVGFLRGTDPDLADEYFVFTAHYDHLGMDPAVEGDDKIFNGAADNALGIAGMLAAAKFAVTAAPRRSIIFVATTAEEGGLLGSSSFVADPPVPLRQIVANFNIDSPQAFGLTRDVGAIGLQMSSLGTSFAEVAAEHGLKATGDPNPNAGSFYRSDQVNFAKAGIPALYLQRGTDFVTPPSFDPEELRLLHYHQVTDEILPEWNLAGVVRDIRIFIEAALRAANADAQPRWVEGHEFEEEWKVLYGPPDYAETDIETLQALMQQGQLSSRELTQYYLDRIDAIDRSGPRLNSIIELNPQAIEIAMALDAERLASGSRGPMHGIPVVLKANIDTADAMETTAGSLAMKGHRPPADAFVVERLRAAGAVILAKANLSEWANFRSTESSSGWSSIGGQTKNPYGEMRNPCGSSSGSAVSVAASLTTVAVGTETNGSIVCPASVNGIVGIKPTLGLVSRSGIIPIAHSQDTAGPMGRTVKDTAILLSAMVGADPADPLAGSFPDTVPDFAGNLSKDALSGKRIGVYRGHSGAGNDARVDAIVADTIATLKSLGAEIVDPVEVDTEGMSAASRQVLYYEFKADLNKYLEESGAAMKNLADIIEFNDANAETVMPFFGQERMLAAQAKGPLSDPEYVEALEASKRIAQTGLNVTLAEHKLDALIAPTRGPAWMTDNVSGDRSSGISSSSLAAVSGYASVTLPAGDILGLPIGISFIGAEFSDAKLIQFAYALEQAGYARKPPLAGP